MRNKSFIILSILLLSLEACDKNPCDDLDNGVYIYPEKSEGMSQEEAIILYKIPTPILECISTQGLVETCINYPEFRLMWAHPNLQGGFDWVEDMCNGFEELWSREYKYRELMSLYPGVNFERDWDAYTDLENGRYLDMLNRYEVILAQDEILFNLSPSQKTDFFRFMLDLQKQKYSQMEKLFGTVGMEATNGILSRIMYNDNYPMFMEEFDKDETLQIHVWYLKILNIEIITKVIDLSENYLKILENEE